MWRVVSSDVVRSAHHVTRHNTPIHNILSTAPQLNTSQKALGTLPEDGNVMPKHVGLPYIINKMNNNWCICWLFTDVLLGILIFKGLTARRLYKWFSVKRLFRPIHNILSTASQLSISQKALGMLPE